MRTWFLILSFMALAIPNLIFGLPVGTDPEVEIEPPSSGQALARVLRLARPEPVYEDPKIIQQTEFKVEDRTAFLITKFANGKVRKMRISARGVVRQGEEYLGWPYIIDNRGRLWAVDISWTSFLRSKLPVVVRRLQSRFPYAATSGVGWYAFGMAANLLHMGTEFPGHSDVSTGVLSEDVAGALGFFGYYAFDVFLTLFARSNYRLQQGGNFFRTLIMKDVDHLERTDSMPKDYVIVPRRRTASKIVYLARRKRRVTDQTIYLSHATPPYTHDTDCIYYLTKMVNE